MLNKPVEELVFENGHVVGVRSEGEVTITTRSVSRGSHVSLPIPPEAHLSPPLPIPGHTEIYTHSLRCLQPPIEQLLFNGEARAAGNSTMGGITSANAN